jgi:hypothetical protein
MNFSQITKTYLHFSLKNSLSLPTTFFLHPPPPCPSHTPATEATIYCDEALSQQQFSCAFFVVVAKFTKLRASRPYPHGLDSVWPVLGMNRHTPELHLNAYQHYPPTTICTFNCKYSCLNHMCKISSYYSLML